MECMMTKGQQYYQEHCHQHHPKSFCKIANHISSLSYPSFFGLTFCLFRHWQSLVLPLKHIENYLRSIINLRFCLCQCFSVCLSPSSIFHFCFSMYIIVTFKPLCNLSLFFVSGTQNNKKKRSRTRGCLLIETPLIRNRFLRTAPFYLLYMLPSQHG